MPIRIPFPCRLILASIVLWASLGQTTHAELIPSETPPTSLEHWQMTVGDSLVVDTKENVGYLVHADGDYTAFPVATGQHRVVRYIGRTYDASTPNRSWTVEKEEKKGDHITFGKSGRFLRLNKHAGDDDEDSAYGIHSHAYADKMLSRTDRYRSMGCVIVTENMLDVIEATFKLNDDRLRVVTVNGLGEELGTSTVLQNLVQANTQKDL